ncbi:MULTISPECIES: mannose-6-phosphate isomerase, class I [unclassified Kitasatospora]|uniref:mannose-6-phosphate isomerase, class I n=1 Tax=unclassified Kitasatospora TaxID=2633591 RepID=UPI00071096CA|nr:MULTISPECIES: mannose-6-phosphate isomerase, class I [unclassified Kitasatospora]KQV22171.1 mannose-6-phosphate isomerase [Kitasatospora sp. Root107]KRB64569.1 mannose-6-phosphate isomerase [Kitasatospora sp. Root187]
MDRLANTVRPYAWGSVTTIPELLGVEATGEPQAELWMGAHPSAPSRVDRGGGPRALDELIEADPQGELGAETVARFGPALPFLFKVLAAGAPLSIQAHPTLAQATSGFAAEEARGIPLDAPERNYRDANHKPELICALDEFEGLCGFRQPAEAADLLASLDVPELTPLVELLRNKPESEALSEAVAGILSMTGESAAAVVAATAAAIERAAAADDPTGQFAGYAFAAREFPGDTGLLIGLLLNHFVLQPGEALYLGAGLPHGYLRGTGTEIMANSDNVLRCGLTPKHVDVAELLRVVDFRAGRPEVLRPTADSNGEELYPVPIDEFRLSRFVLAGAARVLDGRAPQILLCTEGSAELTAADGTVLTLDRGQSAFLPGTGTETVLTGSGTTVFRATVTL